MFRKLLYGFLLKPILAVFRYFHLWILRFLRHCFLQLCNILGKGQGLYVEFQTQKKTFWMWCISNMIHHMKIIQRDRKHLCEIVGKPLNKAWESWKLCDFFFAQFVSANNWIGTINSPVSRPEVLQTSLKIRTWMCCCREDLDLYARGRIKCWIGCLQKSEWLIWLDHQNKQEKS